MYSMYTVVVPLSDATTLEGAVYARVNTDQPEYNVVMDFVGPIGESLPRVQTGHWRLTFTYEDEEYNVGVKLNADGTTEPSPVGDSSLGPDVFWSLNRGDVFLGNSAIQFRALILSPNRFEGSYYVDSPGRTEYGFFHARFVPSVVEGDIPDEQAPIG
jgi:hypothetical protein